MPPISFQDRLDALRRKQRRPRVLDLFAGCGGFSLGFQRAGCSIVGGVELDEEAARSHAQNFFRGDDKLVELHGQAHDINACDPGELLGDWGLSRKSDAVDILVGGPPCHAFSRVGRAKLNKTLGEDAEPEAYRSDARAKLWRQYLRFVEGLKPLAVVMENVPDILNWGGRNVAEEICRALQDLDYECRYTLLNAARYGVPQTRERFVLIGVRRALRCPPRFPGPTHQITLPPGYAHAREVALRLVRGTDDLFARTGFEEAPVGAGTLPPAVTAWEAMADLPKIHGHRTGDISRGMRRPDERLAYLLKEPHSTFATLMRTWPGFASDGAVVDHWIRSLSERDYLVFERMKPGDEYPAAVKIAEENFARHLTEMQQHGHRVPKAKSAEWERERKRFVPPYKADRFPNKWRKLEENRPSRTLMAHLGKDSYSHIHYDSEQARTISVREAARLQSFPDGFRFAGAMNSAFRQIGNAVPPLLATAVAAQVLQTLGVKTVAETSIAPPRADATEGV